MEGSVELALIAALTFLAGLVLETRVLLRWRTDAYFTVALPLGAAIVPIRGVPTGRGRTPSVMWEVSRPGLVRFWANPDERRSPTGLHGVVRWSPGPGGTTLDMRWAPPWSPLFAALWLAFLGAARGEGQLTIPIAMLLTGALGFIYWDRSRRIAAELRFAFTTGDPGSDEGEEPR